MTAIPLSNESQRLSAVLRYHILDTPPEASYDRLTALAARLFQVPLAFICLMDSDRLWFKSHYGSDSCEIPRDLSFCKYTVLERNVMVVEDARNDCRFRNNPFVTEDPHIRFYAGVPLITSEGQAIGTLCLLDFHPRQFTADQQGLLTDIAASVVSEMELRLASESLRQSEHLYRQMFEASPQPMWVYDTDTLGFLAVNAAAMTHYGYSQEEFLSMTLCDIRPPQDVKELKEALQKAAPGTRAAGTWRHQKKNGEMLWAEIAAHPFLYEGVPARMAVATDVTERRNTEAALRASESRLRMVISNLPIIVWALDMECCFTFSDGAGLAALGLTPEQVVGLSALEVYRDYPDMLQCLRDGLAGKASFWTNQVNGIDFETTITPLLSEKGSVTGLIGVSHDITARKKTEEALRASELLAQGTLDGLSAQIAILDAQGFIQAVNRAWRTFAESNPRLNGQTLSPHEVAEGANYLQICEQAQGRGAHDASLMAAGIRAVLDGKQEMFTLEYPCHAPQENRWFTARVTPFPGDGAAKIIISHANITARKEAENALRKSEQALSLHVQQTPLGVIEWNTKFEVTAWNPAAERIFGYPRGEAMGRQDIGLIISDSLFPQVEDVRKALLAQSGGQRSTNENLTRDGRTILCEWYNTPLANADGQVIGVASLVQDITEQAQAQKQLQENQERYKSLFERNADGVCSFDLEGRFESVNTACEALTGYGREELMQLNLSDVIVPEYQEASRQRFLLARQGTAQTGITAILSKQGYRVEISTTTIPIVVGDAVVGIYAIVKDITERRKLETDQEHLLEQTEFLLAEALERADRDPLTGLLNHRAFHKKFEDEANRAYWSRKPLAIALMDLDNFKFFNDAYGHLAGDDVLKRVAHALGDCCRDGETLARFGGDEFALLMPDTDAGQAAHRGEELQACLDIAAYRPPGYDTPIPLCLATGIAILPQDGPGRLDALAAADERLRYTKTGGQTEHTGILRASMSRSLEGFSMLDALVTAVDNKDRYTRRHSEDVMTYSVQIAQELGMDEQTLHTVQVAALLHDVGKIGVPDAILRKPGKLSDEDFQAIQQHPMMGAIIVGAVLGFEETLDAVRHHHERWDGRGYPFGLRKEETPLLARLMAVADAFSAMTTDRPYRKGMSKEKALRILADGAGTQWDPACVAAFLRVRQPHLLRAA